MTDHKGVLLFDKNEPKISGYLIIDGKHYQIVGKRISDIRTNLHIRHVGDVPKQEDLFDERSDAGDIQRDLS